MQTGVGWWQHSQAEEATLEEEPRDKMADVADVDADEKGIVEEGDKATLRALDGYLKETRPG